jgi:Mn-dependent DtxR family transcriptional regulator
MSKKISNTTSYAIQWLNHKKVPVADIAKELNISEESVSAALAETTEEKASRISKLMISETAGKRNKGVAIMTKEASFLSDEVAKKTTKGNNNNTNIFRPRG